MEEKRGRFERADYIFLLGLFVCVILAWIRSRYGMGVVDEAFFLSLGDKIYRGNAMLVHEWHASQFTFFLIQPLFVLFHLFRRSNEGMILFFRYAYVIVQAIVSIFIYLRTRKYTKSGAGVAAIVYFLFCPLLQQNFNYNSIALICLHVALILILTAEKKRPLQLGIAGFFFAGAVLCCPALLALYLLYSVIVILKKNAKEWLWFTVGCAVMAAAFFLFLLSRASFSEILSNATHVLDDPEHPAFNPGLILISYVFHILEMAPFAGVVYVGVILLTLITYLSPELLKKKEHLLIGASVLVTGLIVEMAVIGRNSEINSYPLNRVLFPVNILAPFCALLYDDKKMRKIFTGIWVPGILYGVCISFISNLGIYSICSASSVATTASVLILAITYEKYLIKTEKIRKMAIVVLSLLFTCLIGSEIFLRAVSVYPGSPTSALTETIDSGTEEGIRVTPGEKRGYASRLEYTSFVREYPSSQKAAYITYHYWIVLEDWDVSSCTPSNLLTGLHPYTKENPNTVVIERLDKFYQLNPDRVPEVIYIDTGYDDVEQWYIDHFRYDVYEKEERGTILLRQNTV